MRGGEAKESANNHGMELSESLTHTPKSGCETLFGRVITGLSLILVKFVYTEMNQNNEDKQIGAQLVRSIAPLFYLHSCLIT